MEFDPPVYTDKYKSKSHRSINKKNIHRNTWLFPVRCNQGGYDIAFLDEKGVIYFFQVTIANKHDYKFGSLVPSLDLLCSKDWNAKVHYCVLIPEKNKDIFKIGPTDIIEANLMTLYDDGWTWTEPITQDSLATVTPDYKNTTRISVYLVP